MFSILKRSTALYTKRSFHTSIKVMASFEPSKAIITYKSPDSKSLNWKYEPIQVRTDLKPHELLVDITAVGICHTDIALGLGGDVPKILGHEGVGFIKGIGSGVKDHKVGDRVVLSYSYCQDCHYCNNGYYSYCSEFSTQNLADTDKDLTFYQGDESHKVDGKFFGQSSFAKLSVVNEASIVNLEKFAKNITEDQFKHLGPFGCGFQTGAGAILNAGALKPKESVVIYGLGGVGFAGLLASKIGGASEIIVVDLLESKLELARQAGATHTIQASKTDPNFVPNEIARITGGRGVDLSLECVGGSRFVEAAIKSAAPKGKIVFLGVSGPDDLIKIPLFEFLLSGKQLISCIEGNAFPQEFAPKLINHFLDGEFGVDKIIKFYKVEEFGTALQDMKEGKAIKPILLFN